MPATSRYVTSPRWTGTQALSTSYASVTVTGTARKPSQITGVFLYMTTLSGASTFTVGISRDASGDEWIMPPTAASVSQGATTSTDGTVVYDLSIDYPGAQGAGTAGTLYVWVKTAAGTATLTEAVICEVE